MPMRRIRHESLYQYSDEELEYAQHYGADIMRCFECGWKAPHGACDYENFEEHHVVSRRFFGTKTVTLCKPCHRLAGATSSTELIRELGKEAMSFFRQQFRIDPAKMRAECRKHGFTPINQYEVKSIILHLRRIEEETAEYDLPATHRAIEALLKKFTTKDANA